MAPNGLPLLALIGGSLAAFAAGCGSGESCLAGDCRGVEICAPVEPPACGGSVSVERLGAGGGAPGLRALGVPGDVVLRSDEVIAVIDDIGSPHLLAPSGGNLLDVAPVGGAGGDMLNQIYQVAGILPEDALRYDSLELDGGDGTRARVIARGSLDGRPDVRVVTVYELRACEQGLRMRTELHSGGAEPFTFFLADVAYWGGREPVPFSPEPEQGFVQPELDLVTLDSWGTFPFVATSKGLAWVSCGHEGIDGINDTDVTAVGEPRQIVQPGERVVYERFLVVGEAAEVEAAARQAHAVRAGLGRGAAAVTLAGRVLQADGAPLGVEVELVAVEIDGEGRARPWTQTRAGFGGDYAITVPAGARVRVQAWQFGRVVAAVDVTATATGAAVPELTVPAPAVLEVGVAGTGGEPIDALVVVAPADEATRLATRGTQLGALDEGCAPWLGPPHGGSPACNRVLVRGSEVVAVPPGHYFVYASAGPFATLAREEITIAGGESRALSLVVRELPELAPGLLSVDLHVHGRRSFDSSIPDADRVLSFATAGVQVIAATDHDVVGDYAEVIEALGLGSRVAAMTGLETTGLIPFLRVPGDDFPRVIGHFNFWPVAHDAGLPRAGAPFDERLEPGALLDEMATHMPGHGLSMLNHPWDEPLFGRDLGYLRAVGYDPREPIPIEDDGSAQGMLARRPGGDGGHGNLAMDVIEVLNGDSITKYLQYRTLWWALLSAGRVMAGAANSDSHGLSDSQLGWPRNLVRVATGPAGGLDEVLLNASIAAGRMQGGYGIVIDADIDGARFGLTPITPAAGAELNLEVRAAPWIPVAEVRVVVNGVVVRVEPTDQAAGEPFGSDGLVRYTATIPLAELLPAGGGDAWLLVEAGLALPPVADLDDDGVPDTSDNDGDGDVDQRDVEPDEESGPLEDPPDPPPWSDDPRAHVAVVAPGTWPTAFTNPWLIDVDGDGAWQAPGP